MEAPVWVWVLVTLGAAAIGVAGTLLAQRQSQKSHEKERAADRKHERELRAVEAARRAAPEFVEAVFSLKVPLDRIVSYYTGEAIAPGGVDAEEQRERKIDEAAKEFIADRVTALRVRVWQVRVACGVEAAGTAEEIVDRLANSFAEVKEIQLWKQARNEPGVLEGGDKCRKLSKEIEALLRRFAEQVRTTTGYGDEGIAGAAGELAPAISVSRRAP